MGSIYKRGRIYWVKFYRNGRSFRESSESEKKHDAERLLKLREGDVARGLPVTPKRLKFEELAEDVVADYRINGKRTLKDLEARFRNHILPVFGHRRAAGITTSEIRKFVQKRQEEGASNAEINRELAAIKRAFNLAVQAAKIHHRPHVPMLRENNVRKGFFEREQFESVRRNLPGDLRNLVTFAYVTGWRIRSEVQTLRWSQVDFRSGRVYLEPGETKNEEARIFPFTEELREVLEERRRSTRALVKAGTLCPWVFHRGGRPIRSFRRAWETACRKAGLPGRIVHDFRRTAVRNLVRSGVPERVAMQLTGHKTRSVFDRYNIVSEGDLETAARKLDEFAGTFRAQSRVPARRRFPQVL